MRHKWSRKKQYSFLSSIRAYSSKARPVQLTQVLQLVSLKQHNIHTYSIHMHTTVYTYTHTIVVTRECSRAQQGIEHLREAHPL